MSESGADLLRRAAAMVREVAEGATPGPWQVGQDVDSGEQFVYDSRWTELAQVAEWSAGLHNADHIALMDPAVSLALADWLDHAADISETTNDEDDALAASIDCDCPYCKGIPLALILARALLGEES